MWPNASDVDGRKVSKRQQYTEEWYATRTLIT